MASGKSLEDYLDEFNKIILDLENIEIKIEDEDQALLLLRSLPTEYESLSDALLYGRESLTLEDIQAALFSKELKRKSESKQDSNPEILNVRERNEKRDFKPKKLQRFKSKEKLKRFLCKREGHFKRDCPERKKGFHDRSTKSGDAEILCVGDDYEDTSDQWVLDSGCIYHMCPHKEWFCSYKNIEGAQVLLGNNKACKVAGVGSIRLKLDNGNERVLGDVRHVPDLKKNLISLGMLDMHGFSCKAERGAMKVSKGSLVVMKRRLENGLYLLQAKAVIGDVSIVSKEVVSDSHLWHRRLAHINEGGLKELSKQGLLGNDKIT